MSYIKARAEGAGLSADGGLVERAERLIIALVGTGLHGLGVPYALHVALWVLAAASVWTVGQRIVAVYRSARAAAGPTAAADRPARPTRPRTRDRPAGRPAGRARASGSPTPSTRPRGGWRGRAGRWCGGRVPARAPTSRPAHGGGAARGCARNLARVVPAAAPAELDALVRAGLRSYARYWCEMFRLPADGPGRRARRHGPRAERHGAVLRGAAARAAGWCSRCRTAATGTPRACGWSRRCAGSAGSRRSPRWPQRLRPESLYRRFVAYRESLGFEVVAAEDGHGGAPRAHPAAARAGAWSAWSPTATSRGSGVEVSFFGEPAPVPGGPGAAGRPDRRAC